ncbi:hypothetical protein ONZ45_g3492 [Pleurotus djamor]|nr:hypothetical protein ONZ45_g3492 [Pleurotus djamor]
MYETVLATLGLGPLCEFQTVATFIHVMYDILEGHRFVVQQNTKLGHPGAGSILPEPTLDIDSSSNGRERPRFILELLTGKKYADPLAVLLDLDHAAPHCRFQDFQCDSGYSSAIILDGREDGPTEDTLNQLNERTSTPMFIARSVAVTRVLFEEVPTAQFPILAGHALTAYQTTYDCSAHPLRSLEDGEKTVHGSRLNPTKQRRYKRNLPLAHKDFRHEPRHDAESIFWCILTFLLRSLPENVAEDINNGRFNVLWKCIATYEIDKFNMMDSRRHIFSPLPWADILHKDLSPLADLISELVDQVQPEYALLDPPPHICHLHEALQRILFKYSEQFRAMGFDVALSTQHGRFIEEITTISIGAKSQHTNDIQRPWKVVTGTVAKNPSQTSPSPGLVSTTTPFVRALKRVADALEITEVTNKKRQRHVQ